MNGPLLDPSVLIAASFPEHEHFERADAWLGRQQEFAVCPITEGALVRFAMHLGTPGGTVQAMLTALHAVPACTFVADSVSYRAVELASLRGHRQVTDAYLLALAKASNRLLATFDQPLLARGGEWAVEPVTTS